MIHQLPFILSIGPQRAGTSWLDRYLRYRGDICLPEGVKEVFYFDRHYHKGFEFYQSHFQPKPEHKLAMEFTTTSFDDPDAPSRVLETFGQDLKLLCPLRDPITRSYSLYLHYKRYGLVQGELREACEQQPQILTSSHYEEHLNRWFEHFSPEHVHVIFQEFLDQNQEGYVQEVCDILNLTYMDVPDDLSARYNSTTKPPSTILARYAQTGADFLRAYGVYAPINFAKRLGLKKIIFGEEGRKRDETVMSAEEEDFMLDVLGPEREKLSRLLQSTYNKSLESFFS